MDKHIVRKPVFLFAALLLLLACEIPALSAPASSDTEPLSIETIIAGTAAAAQTQTAFLLPPPTKTPTLTPLPTSTLTETPTSTATVIFIPPTAVKPFVTYSAGSGCELVALKPHNAVMAPRERFETEWTFKNTSTELWLDSNIDFRYSDGTDMHRKDIYDLPSSVPAGGQVIITVSMIAPSNPGNYTSTWVLASNKKTLCKVSISIAVK